MRRLLLQEEALLGKLDEDEAHFREQVRKAELEQVNRGDAVPRSLLCCTRH